MTFDADRESKPDEAVAEDTTGSKTIIEDVFDVSEKEATVEGRPPAAVDLPEKQELNVTFRTVSADDDPELDQDAESEDADGSRISPKMAAGAAAGLGVGTLGGAYVASEAVDQLRDRMNDDVASGTAAESLDVFDAETGGPHRAEDILAADQGSDSDPSPSEPDLPADQFGAATTPRPAPDRAEDANDDQVAEEMQSGASGELLFPDVDEAAGPRSVTPDSTAPRPPVVPDSGEPATDDATASAPPVPPADQVVSESPLEPGPPDPAPPGPADAAPPSDSSSAGTSSSDDSLSFTEPPADQPDSSLPDSISTIVEPVEDFLPEPDIVIPEPVIIQEPPDIVSGLGPDPDDDDDSLLDDIFDDDGFEFP